MTALSLPLPSATRRTAFRNVLLNEARLTWRQPTALVGGIALPVVLMVVFGEIPSFQTVSQKLGGVSAFDTYVPVVIVLGIAMVALMGLSMPLTTYREQGILRRLSTTPMPPACLLAAQVLVQTAIVVAATLIVLVGSIAVFGAPLPKSVPGIALAVLLSVAGLFPLGLLIAAVAKTANGASVIGRVLFFPMMFFAGLWLPRALMPKVLLDISNYSPLGATVQAIQTSMLHGFPPAQPLLVLLGYAVVLGYLARRLFQWE